MATTTTNYNFHVPELTDAADITKMNENWHGIDSKLKELEDKKTGTLTANRALVSDTNGKVISGTVTTTELNRLKGLTGDVQTQINGKQATIKGGATTITDANLTANRALISDANGKVAVSAITNTELSRLDGVTGNVQTQINGKVNNNGDTLRGSLTFDNKDSYHALHKYRTINGTTYGVNVGCGILGGDGVVSLEVRRGTTTTGQLLGRLEIGERGVSFVNANDKRYYLTNNGVAFATVE